MNVRKLMLKHEKHAVGGSNLLPPASPTHLSNEAGVERGEDGERTEEDEEEVEGAFVRDLVPGAVLEGGGQQLGAVALGVKGEAVLEETRKVVERGDDGQGENLVTAGKQGELIIIIVLNSKLYRLRYCAHIYLYRKACEELQQQFALDVGDFDIAL